MGDARVLVLSDVMFDAAAAGAIMIGVTLTAEGPRELAGACASRVACHHPMHGCGDRRGRGKAIGRVKLRQRQWQLATAGSTTMMIWLGKCWLGHTDKVLMSGEKGGAVAVEVILVDEI